MCVGVPRAGGWGSFSQPRASALPSLPATAVGRMPSAFLRRAGLPKCSPRLRLRCVVEMLLLLRGWAPLGCWKGVGRGDRVCGEMGMQALCAGDPQALPSVPPPALLSCLQEFLTVPASEEGWGRGAAVGPSGVSSGSEHELVPLCFLVLPGEPSRQEAGAHSSRGRESSRLPGAPGFTSSHRRLLPAPGSDPWPLQTPRCPAQASPQETPRAQTPRGHPPPR